MTSFIRNQSMLTNPVNDCRYINTCKISPCPLEPLYHKSHDSSSNCKLPKEERIKISWEHPGILQYNGLTHNEFKKSLNTHYIDPHNKRIIRE